MAALTLIWYLVTRGFALAWEHLPWLVIAWGLSGIALLTLAFIYSARILYYAGGWDLGIFAAIWLGASVMNQFD